MSSGSVFVGWEMHPHESDLVSRLWPPLEILSDERPYRGGTIDGRDVDDVIAIVGFMRTITAELVLRTPRLRLIQMMGHGLDGILRDPVVRAEIVRRDILVARADSASIPIAEFAIMGMIALSRRLIAMHDALALRGDWLPALKEQRIEGTLGGELYGANLLLLGYGPIGREIAKRAAAFGMRVGVLTRRPEGVDAAADGLHFVDFLHNVEKRAADAKYIVAALPLTPDTEHLLSRDAIRAAPAGVYVVNVGRGSVIDEQAVIDGLRSGHVGGAALDVWEREDVLGLRSGYPVEKPIHHLNVIMTPHYSGVTREARERALATIGQNLYRLLAGEPVLNRVSIPVDAAGPAD